MGAAVALDREAWGEGVHVPDPTDSGTVAAVHDGDKSCTLANALDAAGVSLAVVADASGVSKSRAAAWSRGEAEPHLGHVRRMPASVRRALVGVAVFSVPMRPEVLRPFDMASGVELGRLVLLDRVLANAESWFVARCFDALRAEGVAGVVSFSDPVARTDAAGSRTFVGHIGTTYQALNATYTGRGGARTLRLLPDGTVFSARAASKIRARDQGWRYAVGQLVAAGAPEPADDTREALTSWLPLALGQVTRTLRHGGNHRYVWALDRRDRKHLPASLPYPKVVLA